MELTGLHLLLTYKCTYECDHCFAWGSPWQTGTMTLRDIDRILDEARSLGTVKSIYFEGGEPFLYYGTMLAGIAAAREQSLTPGIVTNAYWATSVEDAKAWLEPLRGRIGSLLISCDAYHAWSEEMRALAKNAETAAKEAGMAPGVMSVASAKESGGPVMYRGRAAAKLAQDAPKKPWAGFTRCPFENPREPGRLHLDPFGDLHFCQGISIGNVFSRPLQEVIEGGDPAAHPILGPLAEGGPAEIARRYGVGQDREYADACHLCYETRKALRTKFPEILLPDGMYGII